MAKPRPPRIEPEDIPGRPTDELDVHLQRVYFRNINNIDQIENGNLNQAWASFEALAMLFPLLENDVPFEKAMAGLPVPNWRDETVEIPVALMRQIVEGWNTFRDSENKTLGQAYEFEHVNRQGKSPMKRKANELDAERRYANQVEIRYRKVGTEKAVSLADVIADVAEKFDVSESTVERSYARHRRFIDRNLSGLKVAQHFARKTSGSADVD